MLLSYFAFLIHRGNIRSYTLCFTRRHTGRKMLDLGDMRMKYNEPSDTFTEEHLVSAEPIGQFNAWFEEVKKCKEILEPNAVCLATANKNGAPSARMVLLKAYGPEGFKFFTNYESRKGQDLEENPQAGLTFFWPSFNRQVRIEGKVKKVSEEESTNYFERRPLSSRVSAAVSPQSRVVPSRQYLIDACDQLLLKGEPRRPSFWGGYIVYHEKVEFWQGQSDRLHDRIIYERDNDNWKIYRIGP